MNDLEQQLVEYEAWVLRIFLLDIREYRAHYTYGGPGYNVPNEQAARFINMGLFAWLEARGFGELGALRPGATL